MSTTAEASVVDVETNENEELRCQCNQKDGSVPAVIQEENEITVDITDQEERIFCPQKQKLQQWLNKNLRIEMTDGRILIGVFLCTDRDSNIILGSCSEFLTNSGPVSGEDARILGLVMIPGRHIVSIQIESAALVTT